MAGEKRYYPRPEDRELFELAWKVESRFQLSCWDSMIVAAAQLSRCRYLLSEDLGQGTRVNDLRVISPFSTSWESLEQAPE